MDEQQKKQAGSFVVGGGAGFLLGWLLHRPKAATVGGQWSLSNLVVEPTASYPGGKVFVDVDLTNIGPQPASCRLTLRAGNDRRATDVSLDPGEVWHQTWAYLVEDMFFSVPEATVRISVSVDPLEIGLPLGAPA